MTQKRLVLVVDDDPDIRGALRDVLEEELYPCAEATDGSTALAYLSQATAPALILLDWNMQPMNGRDFMGEVAKRPQLRSIPIVLMTADPGVASLQDATFAARLDKPVQLTALLAMLERYCG